MNEKKENQTYKYGCIMGFINKSVAFDISDKDIYNNDENEFGIEINPHVTILYGLHSDINEQEVIEFLQQLKLPEITLTSIDAFENDEYDVLKWDVDMKNIKMLNKITCNTFEYTTNFPDYKPHVTIAYLKKGTAINYTDSDIKPETIQVDKWVYSQASGRKIEVDANGNVNVIENKKEESVEENKNIIIDYNNNKIIFEKHDRLHDVYFCSVLNEQDIEIFKLKNFSSIDEGLKIVKKYLTENV